MIKRVRKEIGLTQEQLAERSGTSKYHIARLEKNRTGIELATLIKIIEDGRGRNGNKYT